MNVDTLKARLKEYPPANALEQENALREILQGMVLAALSRAGMFREAMFHGGTCLRIINGMNRFSEDLDFLLKHPDPAFRWQKHLNAVRKDCLMEGIRFDVLDKSEEDTAVQKAWLKTDSIGKELVFNPPFTRIAAQKIRIKLEIDINPPAGSVFETNYLSFPASLPVTTQDLPSAFATKTHALLCRKYVKGRDWYDFLWFAARNTCPRWNLLANALFQQGPWAGRETRVDANWFVEQMKQTVRGIDWPAAVRDVQRFLPLREQEGLKLWSIDFFEYHIDKLANHIAGPA